LDDMIGPLVFWSEIFNVSLNSLTSLPPFLHKCFTCTFSSSMEQRVFTLPMIT
jgi:hypothetical protein